MKTAVSLPDDLFREAEKLAKRQRKSRSKLYGDALREYVARHDEDTITAQWDRAIAEAGDPPTDPFVMEAARLALERVEW